MTTDKKKKISFMSVLNTILPILSLGLLYLIWVSASRVNSELVPAPAAIIDRLVELFVTPVGGMSLIGHALISLQRVFLALTAASVIGISFGVMMGWNRMFRAVFGTLFEIIRPIPPIAWLPIIIMWFGIGEFPKVLIVFIGTFMAIVINTYTGIRLIDSLNLDVGRAFNASNGQLLTHIALPSALPAIFAGIRNATSGGWMTVLAAEMIGAKAGMGYLITRGMEFFDVPLIMVGMITIGIVGALLAIITDYIERLICPWNRKRA